MLQSTNSIAKIISFQGFDNPNFFLIDEVNRIEITGPDLEEFDNEKWKLAKLNEELIAFKNIVKQENDIYVISGFIRGCYGTENHAKNHRAGSKLIIIKDPNIIPISEDLIGQELEFRVGEQMQELCFQNRANLLISPLITVNYIENSILHLEWASRNFQIDNWYKKNKKSLIYNIKIICTNQTHNFDSLPGENKMDINVGEFGDMEGYVVEVG